MTVRFAEEVPIFNQMVMRLPIGKPVEAVVLRRGAEKTISVTPAERESVDARVREIPLLGITASNLTSWAATELKRPSRDGVRVRGIRPGGPADEAKPSLRDDDVIVSVDGKAIGSFEALEKTIEALTRGKEERVAALVGFERAGERLLDGHRRRPCRARGSRARGPQGLGAGVGAGADARAGRTSRRCRSHRRARHPRLRRVGADGWPARRRHRRRARRQCRSKPRSRGDTELFATLIRQYKIGTVVRLTLLRDGKELIVPVTLDTSPRLPREMKKYEDPNFEFRVRDVAAADRAAARLPADQPGVLVDAVREGGWAALGHLADGDLLLAIDGTPVADVESVQKKMTAIADAKPRTVVLQVRRGIRTFFVELETGWPE